MSLSQDRCVCCIMSYLGLCDAKSKLDQFSRRAWQKQNETSQRGIAIMPPLQAWSLPCTMTNVMMGPKTATLSIRDRGTLPFGALF